MYPRTIVVSSSLFSRQHVAEVLAREGIDVVLCEDGIRVNGSAAEIDRINRECGLGLNSVTSLMRCFELSQG